MTRVTAVRCGCGAELRGNFTSKRVARRTALTLGWRQLPARYIPLDWSGFAGRARLACPRCARDRAPPVSALLVLALLAASCAGDDGCCGDNLPAPDAGDALVDADQVDACICPPHWPTCPAGCTPLDAGVD